ncbi:MULTISPECIES: hypothetical protein [unclassified Tolypothrix]|nr:MULTISPECIES: hypothetical protein [unclassified Tolypothrix]EKE98273.1 hypothetical protein FDUTEX481_04428 [Tolypothrix sp. PCC 7601]MBE9084006.1 hypothetical protein [Tolypothrix sp. LEGE 11397]UYD30510.1 hypothetical protein HGR01_37390 [Tolypothrix sp. PCC 7712]UYD38356.1 hypothetical protein HG267_37500 [Tolypothrix sp. PCC 7601]
MLFECIVAEVRSRKAIVVGVGLTDISVRSVNISQNPPIQTVNRQPSTT